MFVSLCLAVEAVFLFKKLWFIPCACTCKLVGKAQYNTYSNVHYLKFLEKNAHYFCEHEHTTVLELFNNIFPMLPLIVEHRIASINMMQYLCIKVTVNIRIKLAALEENKTCLGLIP